MGQRINTFKQHLAAVFDDDLHTKKWHNIVDILIIALILISTIEIFISTFDIDPDLRRILFWIDMVILFFFTIEVSLRIWVAPLVDPKFKGWKGRLRYCFTFHGFIDIISTYPFYFQWLLPFPIAWLTTFRTFRVVRLFRVSRYMKSWRLLDKTFKAKKRELIISTQFLIVITLILSLILYFCEHDRQPDVYDNGFSSVLWAFGQYIGDPGGFAEKPPVTGFGKFIACIVGILGIAIVAVPAGILGSGFTEAIEHEQDEEKLTLNRSKLSSMFQRKLDRPTGFYALNFYRSFADIQARTGMTERDIIETVEQTPGYRVINLASTIPVENQPTDRLAVEHFLLNRSYGVCIDRGSRVTIISSASVIDPGGGTFAFYIALIGGFNFISREVGNRAIYRPLYKKSPDEEYTPAELSFYQDLEKLMKRPGAWSFDILPSSGSQEPEYDTRFHFGIGNPKGEESLGGNDLLIHDRATFKDFYSSFSRIMEEKFDIKCDAGRYHSTAHPTMWPRVLDISEDANCVILRTAWSVLLWNDKRLLIAKTIAECISRYILGQTEILLPEALHLKDIGFKGYEIR